VPQQSTLPRATSCIKDLKGSRLINALKSSRAISRVTVELKTNVSEIFSVSFIRVDVMNYRMSLIFTPVCEIDASSCSSIMELEGGVKMSGHPSITQVKVKVTLRLTVSQSVLVDIYYSLTVTVLFL
jgi:hypothetical protein